MILRLGKWKNSQKKIKVTRNKFIGISKISKLEEAEGIEVGIQIRMYIRIPNRKLSLEREMKIEQEKYRLEMKEVEEVEAEAEETEAMVKEVLEIEDVEIEEEEAEEEVREVIMKEEEEDIENMLKEEKILNIEKKKYRMKVKVGGNKIVKLKKITKHTQSIIINMIDLLEEEVEETITIIRIQEVIIKITMMILTILERS
jgi:hypothetical protein